MNESVLSLPVTAPCRLDLTAWVLRRRPKNAIDAWDGQVYSRVLVVAGRPLHLTVRQAPPAADTARPHLLVRLRSLEPLTPGQLREARTMIRRLLGLDADVRPFRALAANSAVLAPLERQFRGVRPPRFPTVFEALTNAIACQQVSLDAGIALLNRLTAGYGLAFPAAADRPAQHAFPRPVDVLDLPESDLQRLGFSYQKARSIKAVALAIAEDDTAFERLELAGNDEVSAYLQALHGIGRWSAEYVLLRGLGRLDVFPGDDIGGQNNVQQLLGLSERPNYTELQAVTAAWQPYAGFVYFHLLLDKLHTKGLA